MRPEIKIESFNVKETITSLQLSIASWLEELETTKPKLSEYEVICDSGPEALQGIWITHTPVPAIPFINLKLCVTKQGVSFVDSLKESNGKL